MVEKPLTPLCGWKPLRQLVMSRVAVSPAACHISRGRLQSPFQWAKKKSCLKIVAIFRNCHFTSPPDSVGCWSSMGENGKALMRY